MILSYQGLGSTVSISNSLGATGADGKVLWGHVGLD